MKIKLVIGIILLSCNLNAQIYRGTEDGKVSKMINLNKMVRTYKKGNTKILKRHGFVQDTIDVNSWYNENTHEEFYMDDKGFLFWFNDDFITNENNNGINKVGMVLNRMWVRFWSWGTGDFIFGDYEYSGVTMVKVKGEVLALVSPEEDVWVVVSTE